MLGCLIFKASSRRTIGAEEGGDTAQVVPQNASGATEHRSATGGNQ